MDFVMSAFQNAQLFWQNYAIAGAIMVSIIIALIGAFKPIIFNRIKNDEMRRFALSMSNTAGAFASNALCFAFKQLDWSKYVVASIVLSVCCILIYHLYETVPYLRKSIEKVTEKLFGRFYEIGVLVAKGATKAEIQAKVEQMTEELNQSVKNQFKPTKKSKKDKELENL